MSVAVVREKLVPLLGQLIRNACVNDGSPDSGHELRSAETLKDFFAAYGLSSEIMSLHPDRGNILLKLPGRDPGAPSLMLMGHLDVVPANPEEWSFDPFSGDCVDGFVRGRGAVDMLNMTASMAVAVAECAASGETYPGDILFLGVADEESSGRVGAGWLTANHWDLVKADYMITELGGFSLNTPEGAGVTVTIGEKGLAWTKISVRGTAGHGSMPYLADNAAEKIAEVVWKLGERQSKPVLSREYKNMVRELAATGLDRLLLGSPLTIETGLRRLFSRDPGTARFLHTASRMSVSPNVIRSGSKVNIIADRGEVLADIRTLPGQSMETVRREMQRRIGRLCSECEIDVFGYFPSTISPVDTPLMDATRILTEKARPSTRLVPMFIGGVTDGRYWRSRGTTVYGFTLFDDAMSMSEFSKMIHGRNERISLTSLERSYSYFRYLPGVFSSCLRARQDSGSIC